MKQQQKQAAWNCPFLLFFLVDFFYMINRWFTRNIEIGFIAD